jgi:hypothetical protein
MAAAVPVIAAVAAVGGTVASVENSAQQRRLAGQAEDRQKRDQEVQDMNVKQEKEDEQNAAANIALRDAGRQKDSQASKYAASKNGTLLTGPSGLGDAPTSGGKTLLGS